MKLVLVFKNNADEIGEDKMQPVNMERAFQDFMSGNERVRLIFKDRVTSIINTDHLVSMTLVEEGDSQ